jgi:sugar phosphate isomerase/epimerase
VSRAALICFVLWLSTLAAMPAAAAPRRGSYGARLGAHSMIYLNSTPAEQELAFRLTAAAGLRFLRMDFAVGQVFPRGAEEFAAVDRVNALAARYGVEILGVITTTPWYIAACPGGAKDHLERCAPAPQRGPTWRRMVARIAQRASNVRFWELGNEPDIGFGFNGPAADYARWAGLAAEGIRAARADAKIAISGFARLDTGYILGALHDAAHPLIRSIDIASIHVRGTVRGVSARLARAIELYRDAGFTGPLWVTETGYPSQPEHQSQAGFQRGPRDQARWLRRALRSLVDRGAGAVFVTLRDNPEFGAANPFSSEGIVSWPGGRGKPAYRAVQRLAAKPRSK